MPGLTVLILIVLGWLVFNWLPGFILLRQADKGERISQAIIRQYGNSLADEEGSS